jgi:predicted amidohydrolase YtcJ
MVASRFGGAVVFCAGATLSLAGSCGGEGKAPPRSATTTAASSQPSGALADRIFVNGIVVTMNDAAPQAEAVAVKDGKILAVGTRTQIEAMKGPSTIVQDLAGKTLLPGFVDAHSHLSAVGLQTAAANLLPPPDGPNATIADLQKTARAWMTTSNVPKKYGVVLGFGYDDSALKEQRNPTREELDAISKDLPVYLVHQSGHLGVGNSKALALVSIDASAKDPPGGHIRRKKGSSEPDGVLEENAHSIALAKLVRARVGVDESQALIHAGQDVYLKYGYTTAQDGATTPTNVEGFMAAAKKGQLKIDVVAYPALALLGEGELMRTPHYSKTPVSHFRIGGVKIVLDGALQGKTAWLTKPYLKPPAGQAAGYQGYEAMTDALANAAVERAFQRGWQLLAHVNGDAAIDQLLAAVEEASKKHPGTDRRTVAVHAQTARPDQIDRMKQLGVLPSFVPVDTFYWGDWYRDSVLGPERAANVSPTGWALQRGMTFTSHHDAPVTSPDSMRVLSATVNRVTRSGQVLGPEQRVDPLVALKAMTLWSAYQHFEEKTKGSIEPGKLADLVVLSENPLTVDRAKLANVRVVETIKEGESVYRVE